VIVMLFCLSTSYTSWEKTIHLVASGQMPVSKIITHIQPLEQWKSVLEEIDHRRAIKAVLLP
jgi:threonine dehydrogenase-like Zn-dependent dehydrogenase